jgi:hypothetical protein
MRHFLGLCARVLWGLWRRWFCWHSSGWCHKSSMYLVESRQEVFWKVQLWMACKGHFSRVPMPCLWCLELCHVYAVKQEYKQWTVIIGIMSCRRLLSRGLYCKLTDETVTSATAVHNNCHNTGPCCYLSSGLDLRNSLWYGLRGYA